MKRILAICAIALIIISLLGFIINGGFVPSISLDTALTSLDSIGNKWDTFVTDFTSTWQNSALLDSFSDLGNDVLSDLGADLIDGATIWEGSDNFFVKAWAVIKTAYTGSRDLMSDSTMLIIDLLRSLVILSFMVIKTIITFSGFLLGSIVEFIRLFNQLIGFHSTVS